VSEPAARLAARPPFDSDGLLAFLTARAVPGVEAVDGRTYRRAGVVLTLQDSGVDVAVRDGTTFEDATARARRLLDLDAEPSAIGSVLAEDPTLAPLVRRVPGLRVPGAWDRFEIAIRAVAGQQVTLAAARTLLGRIVARCGTEGFPTPAAILDADLDGIGMPGARIRTLRAVAAAVEAGAVILDGSAPAGEVVDALGALPGIGPWTCSYVALRALGDPDAFPVGDVGLRAAAQRLGLPAGDRDLLAHAERWRPWRSYATLHLWRTLA
jgi:AraC family transcriptional regulator, regulatory protein of adaptative response / DNA-3-methyladenine glycosylase II